MNQRDYAADLGALGYPGFAYVKALSIADPAELLLHALNESDLDSRIAEGLPWLVLTFYDMDWCWLVENAKLQGRQNRLGFIVILAAELPRTRTIASMHRRSATSCRYLRPSGCPRRIRSAMTR